MLFYEKPTDPCILSAYAPNGKGYALVAIKKGNKWTNVAQHRLVYAAQHNMTAEEMKPFIVMHKCDVRNCINPNHLMLGTVADNNKDRANKGRTVGFQPGHKYSPGKRL